MASKNIRPEFDVPAFSPDIPLALQRVGTTGRSFPLTLEMANTRRTTVTAQVEMYVNLSSARRGIHASRFGLDLQKRLVIPYKLPQVFASDLGREVLKSQSVSTSEVLLDFTWTQFEETPMTELASLQTYDVHVNVQTTEQQNYRIGVIVPGFNVCPCVQLNAAEYIKRLGNGDSPDEFSLPELLKTIPMFSHSQRIFVNLSVCNPNLPEFDFRELIGIVKNSIPYSYDILKRVDEVHVVKQAHHHPMFCEDITRLIAKEATLKLRRRLPESTYLVVETTSYESIHSFNIVSRLEASLSDIANSLDL